MESSLGPHPPGHHSSPCEGSRPRPQVPPLPSGPSGPGLQAEGSGRQSFCSRPGVPLLLQMGEGQRQAFFTSPDSGVSPAAFSLCILKQVA